MQNTAIQMQEKDMIYYLFHNHDSPFSFTITEKVSDFID